MKTRREFMKVVGQGAAGGLLLRAIPLGGRLLWRGVPVGLGAASLSLAVPRKAHASVVLNTADISNFTQVGGQAPTPGSVLIFSDASDVDSSGLFAADADAANGVEIDLQATFQVTPLTPHGVDAGFQLVVNDGPSNRSAVAACILINDIPHIGLAGSGPRDELSTYRAFIQADWQSKPLTVLMRRTREGGVKLLELDRQSPATPVEIADLPQLPSRTRPVASSEFGCFSARAIVNATVTEFFTQPVVGVPFASFAARMEIEQGPPGANKDEFEVKGIFTLGDGSDGIDIPVEIVSLELSGGSGGFSTTIPAGSFRQDKKGRFKFETIIDVGVFEAVIRPLGGNTFEFKAEGEGFNLGAIANPVNVSLTIGDDGGTTEVLAEIEP